MAFGTRRYNCMITAPGFGKLSLMVNGLGYGKSIVSSQTESRRYASWYPQVATSGEWYVSACFTAWKDLNFFMSWMTYFHNRVTDPNLPMLLPMTVEVPTRSFRKVGYPVVVAEFGDEAKRYYWEVQVPFVSATDPTISSTYASKYIGPLRDSAAWALAPAGIQRNDPVSSPFDPGSGGGGGRPVTVR